MRRISKRPNDCSERRKPGAVPAAPYRSITAADVVRAHHRSRRAIERRLTVGSIAAVADLLTRVAGSPARAARLARKWEREGGDPRLELVARCLEHAAVA
jgi:hypothetical protein